MSLRRRDKKNAADRYGGKIDHNFSESHRVSGLNSVSRSDNSSPQFDDVYTGSLSLRSRPATTVRDVAYDLYDFRNVVAHGLEIPLNPYRQKQDPLGTDGGRINHRDFYYTELMLEAGLFMLARSLPEVFMQNLVT